MIVIHQGPSLSLGSGSVGGCLSLGVLQLFVVVASSIQCIGSIVVNMMVVSSFLMVLSIIIVKFIIVVVVHIVHEGPLESDRRDGLVEILQF